MAAGSSVGRKVGSCATAPLAHGADMACWFNRLVDVVSTVLLLIAQQSVVDIPQRSQSVADVHASHCGAGHSSLWATVRERGVDPWVGCARRIWDICALALTAAGQYVRVFSPQGRRAHTGACTCNTRMSATFAPPIKQPVSTFNPSATRQHAAQ